MDMSAARIRLTIDRVVLTGIPPEQRDSLADGLHAELTRLLAAPEFRAGLRSRLVPAIRGGHLSTRGHAAGQLGVRTAQRVVQRLRG